MNAPVSGGARHQSDADPWWSDPQPALADLELPRPSTRRRRVKRARTGIGWRLLRLLAAPIAYGWRRLAASPRVRQLALRLTVVLLVLVFLACSVGVILINNVVMGRTAELGELDDRRRELRRDNALLGAEAARLSASQVVARRAERDLGMVRSTELPQFLYLERGSRELTPLQRQRLAARAARLERQRAAAAEAAQAAVTAAATTSTTKAGSE